MLGCIVIGTLLVGVEATGSVKRSGRCGSSTLRPREAFDRCKRLNHDTTYRILIAQS